MSEFRAAVITASDKGFSGERQDASGLLVQKILREAGYSIAYYAILPDTGICWQRLCAIYVTKKLQI